MLLTKKQTKKERKKEIARKQYPVNKFTASIIEDNINSSRVS